MPSFPEYEMLGVRVHAMTVDDLFTVMQRAVEHDRRIVVSNHNMHSVHLYHQNALMRAFYARADYTYIDGMPLVYAARAKGLPIAPQHRLAILDYLRPMLRLAASREWGVLFVGSRPGVGARAAERLRAEIPGLRMEVEHGFFDVTAGSAENAERVERVARSQPQILIVGMGMPRQERWILENLDRLGANVILNQGAIMDYVAGEIRTAPRWMGRVGLEWTYRLATEPRRLGHRYLVEPWSLVPLLARDVAASRLRGRDRVAG